MTQDPDGSFHDTSLSRISLRLRLGALHFVTVEKRGVEPFVLLFLMTQRDRIDAFERASGSCSAGYMQNVTKQLGVADRSPRSLRRCSIRPGLDRSSSSAF